MSAELNSPAAEPRLGRWQKFKMIVKVIELRLRFIALMAITALVFGYWDTISNYAETWGHHYLAQKWPGQFATKTVARGDTEYYCPMHPQVISASPGNCPICGMPLSKRTRGQAETLPQGVLSRVQLSPQRVAQAGVRTVEVSFAPLTESITTVGQVVYDETRNALISSKIKGNTRVEKLFVNYLGSPVQAGQPLAEVYSSELYVASQELLLAHRATKEPSKPAGRLTPSLLGSAQERERLAVDKLTLWGISPGQIDAILKHDRAEYRMTILAPKSGVITKKNVVEGQIVPEGAELFEVADLGHVWIKAQIYEDQAGMVEPGQAVEATVEAYPGEVFPGRLAFIDPQLDPSTRTLGVRFDMENASHRLRPGMYATVTLRIPLTETPAFKARVVRAPEHTTHTRLTAAEQKTCPVTGLRLGTMGDPVLAEAHGHSIWTCCPACKPKFQAKPEKYLARLAPPPRDQVLTVPASAVIDTGRRQVVYVETEPGVFEGREVVLGPRSGDRYPVLEGLMSGESVAAEGAFLIDAETRLNPAAGTVYFGSQGGAPAQPQHSVH